MSIFFSMGIMIWLLTVLLIAAQGVFAEPVRPPQKLYKGMAKIDGHPGFAPFISHIDFHHMADYTIDQSTVYFDPNWVKQGDIIYVNIWFLPWFEEHIHDKIKHPYILLSCDVGDLVPRPGKLHKLLYDPKCAAWFCRNMVFSYHPKLQQIPWGQDLWFWGDEPSVIEPLVKAVQSKPHDKTHLLYMNHFPRKFGGRDKIVKLFEDAPFCFSRNRSTQTQSDYQHVPYAQYYEELGASQFVLSPFGLETDSVRTWEAFVLDCIPIVEHTFLDPQYEGMPIAIVHDWEEITEEFLERMLEELQGKSTEKAYFTYWYNKIKECQTRIRGGDLSSGRLEGTPFPAEDLEGLCALLQKQECSNVIYRGFLATLRPLELAQALGAIKRIFLYDPWQDLNTWNHLESYLTNRSLLQHRKKVTFLFLNDQFYKKIANNPAAPIFLDLTHYRSGLVMQAKDFRHSLKKDTLQLYEQMHRGALLCGNMATDPYVKKVLEMLAREYQIPFEVQGNIWSMIKK